MKKQLLCCSLIGMLTACQQGNDIQPNASSLSGETVGTYRTNFYLDVSCVAVPPEQMPSAELKAESDSSVTLIYTRFYPTQSSLIINHVQLARQLTGIDLRLADSSIGTLKTDRVFTNNGMEKQGRLLRITMNKTDPQRFVYFSGAKQ